MYGRFIALRRAATNCRLRQLAIGFAVFMLFGGLFAQAADLPLNGAPQKQPAPTWIGLGFGLGIAADFDVGGTRVVNAQLVNNIVRVTDVTSNVDVGFVLEAHYFLRDWSFRASPKLTSDNPWPCLVICGMDMATGPFVAVEINGGNTVATGNVAGPITGYALGWMVGLHHPDSMNKTSSWNFGVGLRVDPKTQVLGDGIVANQPLPAGETAIRYKQEPRAGIMLLSSFSW
jgi:hypothetical protein